MFRAVARSADRAELPCRIAEESTRFFPAPNLSQLKRSNLLVGQMQPGPLQYSSKLVEETKDHPGVLGVC